MSWALCPLAVGFAFAACGGADVAPQPPAPHVLVSIADVEDDVCGTSCPVFSERVVRLAPDGTFAAVAGPVLHYGPGAQAWGVHVGSKAVVVRWRTGESMSVPIAHFGPAPRLKWSPGGLRFAVLESVRDRTVDRMLLVEPRQRRSLLVARTPRAIEIESAAFLTDDELIAQTFDAHQHARLTRFDAASGRIVSSRRSSLAVSLRMDWSPKAKRLLVEDPEGLVSVIGLDRPDRARGVKLTGAPSWSPDATRILAVPDEEAGESDSAQLATWPGAARVRLPELEDAQWEPAAATLIGVQGAIVLDGSTAVPRVVQVGADGRVTYVYPAQWPASSGGYFPTSIPTAIEAIEPDYVP